MWKSPSEPKPAAPTSGDPGIIEALIYFSHEATSAEDFEMSLALTHEGHRKHNEKSLIRTKRLIALQVYATFFGGALLLALLLGVGRPHGRNRCCQRRPRAARDPEAHRPARRHREPGPHRHPRGAEVLALAQNSRRLITTSADVAGRPGCTGERGVPDQSLSQSALIRPCAAAITCAVRSAVASSAVLPLALSLSATAAPRLTSATRRSCRLALSQSNELTPRQYPAGATPPRETHGPLPTNWSLYQPAHG